MAEATRPTGSYSITGTRGGGTRRQNLRYRKTRKNRKD
jgi:hypothetical protein